MNPFNRHRIMFLLLAFFCLLNAAYTAEDVQEEEKLAIGNLKDEVELKGLKYRLIGPAWGGRVSRAAGIPGDPSTYYLAAAASGVWKSTDGGTNWKPIFDDQPISSIGSLAIAPSNPGVIYVGSGEANIRGNVAAGNGIYKSEDGGKTWKHVWKQEGQIGTMVVHPANADVAYAAVLGSAFGPNPQRGVYRTLDGGKTWQQVLKKDADTGASDIAIDPNNPSTLFAGLWQARRTPWSMTSGGPGSGLYVSRDGGDTWKSLKSNGLPDGMWGKIGVAVAPSDSRRVYALIEAEKGGLFRSDDGGENWTLASSSRLIRQRAWYYTTITVHPSNPNEVWFPQVPMLKSIDGGKTIEFVKGIAHGDNHDLWIDPKNPKRMIGSDDGGVNITLDGGETWHAPMLPIAQFYHISVDNRIPFHVAGAIQDIGTAQGPSRGLNGGVRNTDWWSVGGGEAGWVVSDPSDPNIVYAGEYLGYISRYDHRTRQARHVGIYPEDASGHGAEDLKYRFQWTAPIAISPHNPKVVYHGGNVLFRTEDGGQSWTVISPDLTRNDKTKQKWSGGPITGDNTGVEFYCTIFTVAESPLQKGLIWVGSDDGLVHVTRDGGKNWKNVTSAMPGIPQWGTVRMIEPSRYDAGTAYAVVEAHRLDNEQPYLFKTTNYGDSWQRLDKGLPSDIYLHAVREDNVRREFLYVGTERGVVMTRDGGKSWRSLRLNMPTVAVHDLAVKDNSLVVGTMGRSIYILDHLSLLREIGPQLTANSFHLFPSPDAIRWQYGAGNWPPQNWRGQNPAGRALFYFWLKDEPRNDITIEITDSANNVVDVLTSKKMDLIGADDNPKDEEEFLGNLALPKKKGLHVVGWDLNYKGSEMIENAKLDWGSPFTGPMVIPGNYNIKLTVDGKTQAASLKVLPDPRVQMTDADYKEQLRFALALRDDITRLTRTVRELRSVRRQLAARNELLKKNEKAADLLKNSDALISKLNQMEEQWHNPKAEVSYDILAMRGGARLYSRMSALMNFVIEADAPPTQGMREQYQDLKKEFERLQAQNQQVSVELASLNDAARKLDFPVVVTQIGK